MTNRDIVLLQETVSKQLGSLKLETTPLKESIKFSLPGVLDRNEEPFVFFAYRRPKVKMLYLTDAGLITYSLRKPGLEVNMRLMQQLMQTYGLIVQQDGCVVEQSNRPTGERVVSLFQAWMAVDGIIRMWNMPKEKK